MAEPLLLDYSVSFQLDIDDSTKQNSTKVLQYFYSKLLFIIHEAVSFYFECGCSSQEVSHLVLDLNTWKSVYSSCLIKKQPTKK